MSTSYFLILVKSKVMMVIGSCPEPLLRCTAGGSWILYQREKINKVGRHARDPATQRRQQERHRLPHEEERKRAEPKGSSFLRTHGLSTLS